MTSMIAGAAGICDPWRVYFENQYPGKLYIYIDAQLMPGACSSSTDYSKLFGDRCREGNFTFQPGEKKWIFETNKRWVLSGKARLSRLGGWSVPAGLWFWLAYGS